MSYINGMCMFIVLLPHIGSAAIETRIEMAELTAKNIIAVLDSAPMPKEVLS